MQNGKKAELDGLRERLKNANLSEVSRRSGISRPSIIDIRDGNSQNPGTLTVGAILGALDAMTTAGATTGAAPEVGPVAGEVSNAAP